MTVEEQIKEQADILRKEWSDLNALLCKADRAKERIKIVASNLAMLESLCPHQLESLGVEGSSCTICGKEALDIISCMRKTSSKLL